MNYATLLLCKFTSKYIVEINLTHFVESNWHAGSEIQEHIYHHSNKISHNCALIFPNVLMYRSEVLRL
uniref:Uncharacterized protein n=1 Tax=Anguilla anguilla TaxID=7936 RepID=A0A0E9U888_ANGAN